MLHRNIIRISIQNQTEFRIFVQNAEAINVIVVNQSRYRPGVAQRVPRN
jgi:hypothetical protein